MTLGSTREGIRPSVPMTLIASLFTVITWLPAAAADVVVEVDASQVLVKHPNSLIGANLEDLNFELYGGLYSQLLYGENFEEHVDPTELLGLTGLDRMKVWVVLDERSQPILRAFRGHPFSPKPYRLRRVYEAVGPDWLSTGKRDDERDPIGGLTFIGGVLLPSELPEGKGQALIALATGPEQISRHWRKVQSGSAAGTFTLVRQGGWNGKQAQRIACTSGTGELGIDNAGLYRRGIALVGGSPYEGELRIQSDTVQEVWASLRAADGTVLAEQALALDAKPGAYQRVVVALTPHRSEVNGRFALTLKRPGTITVDYAFLQPGEWGRFHGLPLLKDRAEAVLGMGVKTLRLNGSMVNKCPDGPTHYQWKEMIVPRDERRPYHGWFNPYATHGFAIFEFLDFCEVAGVQAIIGLRIDETEQDVADLLEYCRGGPETTWGKRCHDHGHPRPYLVTAIQIGNEQAPNPHYLSRFQALAVALWAKDKTLDVLASVNIGDHFTGRDSSGGVEAMKKLATWVRSQGQEQHFILDSHYNAGINHADVDLDAYVGLRLHHAIAAALPGFNLRLWPLEENGERHTWERGLAHAHNLNTMNRMPACLERAGTANTIEAWNMSVLYNQARIHVTPSQIIYQPSYHVDRMFGDEWLPQVVQSDSSLNTLDVSAKKDEQGRILTVYLVNIAKAPVTASLTVKSFTPRAARMVRLHADNLTVSNTPDKPQALVPETLPWTWQGPATRIDIPGYSFTTIRMEGGP